MKYLFRSSLTFIILALLITSVPIAPVEAKHLSTDTSQSGFYAAGECVPIMPSIQGEDKDISTNWMYGTVNGVKNQMVPETSAGYSTFHEHPLMGILGKYKTESRKSDIGFYIPERNVPSVNRYGEYEIRYSIDWTCDNQDNTGANRIPPPFTIRTTDDTNSLYEKFVSKGVFSGLKLRAEDNGGVTVQPKPIFIDVNYKTYGAQRFTFQPENICIERSKEKIIRGELLYDSKDAGKGVGIGVVDSQGNFTRQIFWSDQSSRYNVATNGMRDVNPSTPQIDTFNWILNLDSDYAPYDVYGPYCSGTVDIRLPCVYVGCGLLTPTVTPPVVIPPTPITPPPAPIFPTITPFVPNTPPLIPPPPPNLPNNPPIRPPDEPPVLPTPSFGITLIVSQLPIPNLTSALTLTGTGYVKDNLYLAGTKYILGGTVTNIGHATAGAFPNVYQFSYDGGKIWYSLPSAGTISSLAPKATKSVVSTPELPLGDVDGVTYTMRLCANRPVALVEYDSSDGSNCSTQTLKAASNLNVSKNGNGSGTITSSDSKVNYGSVSSATYTSPDTVILTATPAPGSVFAGWSGDCSAVSGPCTVYMRQSNNVNATFNVPPPPPDMCLNRDDIQETVPVGMTRDSAGNCNTPPPIVVCPPNCPIEEGEANISMTVNSGRYPTVTSSSDDVGVTPLARVRKGVPFNLSDTKSITFDSCLLSPVSNDSNDPPSVISSNARTYQQDVIQDAPIVTYTLRCFNNPPKSAQQTQTSIRVQAVDPSINEF